MNNIDYRVRLIGSPGSGKTTMLAAMCRAVSKESENDPKNNYRYVGYNKQTRIWLEEKCGYLRNGKFPEATINESPELIFSLFSNGNSLNIYTQDNPGKDFIILENNILKSLLKCDGFVFLVKPEVENNENDIFQILDKFLSELNAAQGDGLAQPEPFTQKAAICLSQYDNEQFFCWAREKEFLTAERKLGVNTPVFKDQTAIKTAFQQWPCFTRNNENIVQLFQNYFEENKLSFHALSSIGFYKPDGQDDINWDDCYNVENTREGNKIRMGGSYLPVNLLEPFMTMLPRG